MFDKIRDFLFPPFCVSCNQPGQWWCGACRDKVHLVKGGICSCCLEIGEHDCSGNLSFNNVYSCGFYHDKQLRALITRLKFSGVTVLNDDLNKFLMQKCAKPFLGDGVIVPMPLALKRLKERGFNQAELIAKAMKQAWGLDNQIETSILERVSHREAQSSLDHAIEVRSENVKNVFKSQQEPPGHVILVDDVVTTGATADEAARVLLNAGANRVDLMTLAIGA